MAAADDILSKLPIDDLAHQVGADPDAVRQAVQAAVPALLGGMQANAQDPAGASSLADALSQHDPKLLDDLESPDAPGVEQIDATDGQRIASHIFGGNEDQVVSKLGGIGGGSDSSLVKKLIPMLAPIVMSYVVKQMSAKGASPQAAGGSAITDVLQQVLQGSGQGSSSTSSAGAGSPIGDLLGGLLGGGRRQ